MSIEMTGLADIVRQHASARPDTAAIVHAGRTTTYGALDRVSNRVANGLIAEGIGPQVRVAHLDKSSDIFFELLFGTAKANAVMVSVNWRLAPPEVSHILNDAQAEILFVGEEYFPVIEKIRENDNAHFGYNAQTEVYEDLVASGVIDPAKVTRSALQNAASIAGLMLTTEAMVCEIPEKKSAPAPGGHGPEGMDY